MGCEPLTLPKYFSSPKEMTLYIKKLLGVEKWEKRRTYSIGHGLKKKVLITTNIRVEVVYRVIEEQKEWRPSSNYSFEVSLNRYVSIISALVCREGEDNNG